MEVAICFGIIILACLLIALSEINAHVKNITADIAEKIIAEKNIKNIRKQKLNKIYKKFVDTNIKILRNCEIFSCPQTLMGINWLRNILILPGCF